MGIRRQKYHHRTVCKDQIDVGPNGFPVTIRATVEFTSIQTEIPHSQIVEIVTRRKGTLIEWSMALILFSLALSIVFKVIVVLWIGVVLLRKWNDRGATMIGFGSSWWSPFGIEMKVLHLMASGKVTIQEATLQFLVAFTKMFGPDIGCGRAFIFSMPVTVIWKAEAFEQLLGPRKMVPKRFPYEFMKVVMGNGLVTSNGEVWQKRRRLLTPAFHFRILEDFLPVMNEQARIFTDILAENENLDPIDILPRVEMATFDVICETAMGVKIGAQRNNGSEYVTAFNSLTVAVMNRIFKFWLWLDALYFLTEEGRSDRKNNNIVNDFAAKVIKQRTAEIAAGREAASSSKENRGDEIGMKRRKPFLDLLLEAHFENPEDIPMQGVYDEVATFIGAGYHSTSVGMSWALYFISCEAEVQAKIHQELDEIFGDDNERAITNDDIRRMKYIECCIKESLRLSPSVSFITRSLPEDTEIDGHLVKANTLAIMNIYALHRDPKIFPDPERFLPERFLQKDSLDQHSFAYLPFSAGLRNCIGQKFALMELKVVLAWTLRRFRLRAAIHRDELHIQAVLVTRPREGLPIYIESRINSG